MEREARARGGIVERVGPLYPAGRDQLRNLRDLYSLFRRIRPSIVHYHIPRAFSGFESILAGYLARVPRRIRTDQNPVANPPSRLQSLRLRVADAMVHRIVLVSSDNLRNHLDRCHRPRARCVVIPNGVNVRDIVQGLDHVRRRGLRAELALPPEPPMTVMVAALEHRKGAIDYIRAARVASQILPSLHYAVIGDGQILADMRDLAAGLGIGDRVHFLGRRPDVRRILTAFDVFVLPSHYEGLALTMLEALAAGLPMATTRVDGVSDVLPGEKGALFADVHDYEGLGAAMATLASDPNVCRSLVAVSQERVCEWFTTERMCSRYRRLYQQLGVFNDGG